MKGTQMVREEMISYELQRWRRSDGRNTHILALLSRGLSSSTKEEGKGWAGSDIYSGIKGF